MPADVKSISQITKGTPIASIAIETNPQYLWKAYLFVETQKERKENC